MAHALDLVLEVDSGGEQRGEQCLLVSWYCVEDALLDGLSGRGGMSAPASLSFPVGGSPGAL
jgi:hypothetical protein